MKISWIILFAICLSPLHSSGQFISARATHSTGIVSDNLFGSDLSKNIGGEIYFSKSLGFIPINYNAGADYIYQDGLQSIYAITGFSFIFRTPSGFSATNPENVTYYTNNWLNYADLNILNGLQLHDTSYHYSFGVDLGYNIGYSFTESFFLHTGFGARYILIPQNKQTEFEYSSVEFLIKIGVLVKLSGGRYKP